MLIHLLNGLIKNPQKLTEIVIQDKETPKMGWAQFKGSDMFKKSNSGLYTFECFSGKLLTDNKQTQIPEKLKFNDTFNDMFSKEEQRKMSFEEVTDNTYKFDLPDNMKLTLFSTKKGFDFELEKEGLSFKLSTNNVDLKNSK